MLSRWDCTPNLLWGFRLEGFAMVCWRRCMRYEHEILEAAAGPPRGYGGSLFLS